MSILLYSFLPSLQRANVQKNNLGGCEQFSLPDDKNKMMILLCAIIRNSSHTHGKEPIEKLA
jgi:hypothetical protein